MPPRSRRQPLDRAAQRGGALAHRVDALAHAVRGAVALHAGAVVADASSVRAVRQRAGRIAMVDGRACLTAFATASRTIWYMNVCWSAVERLGGLEVEREAHAVAPRRAARASGSSAAVMPCSRSAGGSRRQHSSRRSRTASRLRSRAMPRMPVHLGGVVVVERVDAGVEHQRRARDRLLRAVVEQHAPGGGAPPAPPRRAGWRGARARARGSSASSFRRPRRA